LHLICWTIERDWQLLWCLEKRGNIPKDNEPGYSTWCSRHDMILEEVSGRASSDELELKVYDHSVTATPANNEAQARRAQN
jgi:hypothetical protein